MPDERVLLIDVPPFVIAALVEAGIDADTAFHPNDVSLAIIDQGNTGAVARLRNLAPELPILGLGQIADVDASTDVNSVAVVAQSWLRSGMTAALERLAATFGRDAIAGLAEGLAALLAETDPDAMRAHRIAGLAGTLGLAALNAPWLAVSEGDRAALPAALRASARAREAIARFVTR